MSHHSRASLLPGIKFSIFENEAEIQLPGLLTQLLNAYSGIRVLSRKNGLAHVNKRYHVLTPLLGKAVFGQRPVEIGQKVGYLVGIVL